MLDNLEPFRPDFDYVYAYPVANPGDEIVKVKMAALEELQDVYSYSAARLAPFVQLLSMVRVEIPRVYRDVVGWDVESSYCASQHLLDLATMRITGFPLSMLNVIDTGLTLTKNHIALIYSTPMLNLLCNMLTNPLEQIVELISDGAMDQITQIETVEAAYKEVFVEAGADFGYPIWANSRTAELVEQAVSSYIEAKADKS